MEAPELEPDLGTGVLDNEVLGNKLARFTLMIIRILLQHSLWFSLENPKVIIFLVHRSSSGSLKGPRRAVS